MNPSHGFHGIFQLNPGYMNSGWGTYSIGRLLRTVGPHFNYRPEHQGGACVASQVVGTDSMTLNPICAFEHRTDFKYGAKVRFKDCKWEAQKDSAVGIKTIQELENLAKKYRITLKGAEQCLPILCQHFCRLGIRLYVWRNCGRCHGKVGPSGLQNARHRAAERECQSGTR
jgi:hypothetical protein